MELNVRSGTTSGGASVPRRTVGGVFGGTELGSSMTSFNDWNALSGAASGTSLPLPCFETLSVCCGTAAAGFLVTPTDFLNASFFWVTSSW
eukprot:3688274-Pyramimonas_sp.AAC.1